MIPRVLLELRRRDKKNQKKLPCVAYGDQTIAKDIGQFNIELELDQYPKTLIFVRFEAPGKLLGIDRGNGLTSIRIAIRSLMDVYPEHAFFDATTNTTHAPSEFALAIAKIGYSFAVAEKRGSIFRWRRNSLITSR